MIATIDYSGATDVGRVRPNNEDHFLIARLKKRHRLPALAWKEAPELTGALFAVADGMGGRAAGERASHLALASAAKHVKHLLPKLYSRHRHTSDALLDELKASLNSVQAKLFEHTEHEPGDRGMGTTLTMACVIGAEAYVVHAGDSRCYLHRDNRLERITNDQTIAQACVEKGIFTPDEAAESPFRNVLWNVIAGDSDELEPTGHHLHLRPGDSLLLCTDGLTNLVSDDEISEALASPLDAHGVCSLLVDAANKKGGTDNITVVVARMLAGPAGANKIARTDERASLADTELEISVS